MPDLVIAASTPGERTWAARLMATSEPWLTLGIHEEKCMKTCHDPEYLLFIAHDENEPCGMVLLDPRGLAGSPYLKSIAVAATYRNRQIGATLLAFAEDLFRKENRHFFLCVSSFNTRARNFYERNGYHPVGELKDYLIPGESEIIMHKYL